MGGALVGRETELEALDEALQNLARGEPGQIVISGEAGIGKTALLDVLAAGAARQGCHVVTARAAEFESDLPWALVAEAVGAAQPDEGLRAAFEQLGAEQQRALMSIRGGVPEGASSVVAAERAQIHAAVGALLERRATDLPMLIALDDVHWADPASVELISSLLRRPLRGQVLLAITLRPTQIAPGLRAAVGHGARAGSVRVIEPRLLDEESVGELLAVGGGNDVDDGRRLAELSGGNPFHVLELIRAGSGRASAGIVEILRSELAALGTDARALAQGAAAVGDPFDPGLAAAAAGLDAPTALDDLAGADLVRPEAGGPRWCFRHPIVRLAIHDGIAPSALVGLHRRAAEELTARDASLPQRAHHIERCAHTPEDAALLEQAARAELGRAPAVAARWLQAAAEVLGTSDPRRIGLLVPLAEALASTGQLDRCREVLGELRTSLPADLGVARTRVAVLMSVVDHLVGEWDRPRLLLEEALAEIGDEPSVEAAAIHLQLASDGLYQGNYDQTIEHALLGRELAAGSGAPSAEVSALSIASLGHYHRDEFDLAREAVGAATRLAGGLDDEALGHTADALAWVGFALWFLERPHEAVVQFRRGLRIARERGHGAALVSLLAGEALALVRAGHAAEATQTAEAALDAALLTGSPPWLAATASIDAALATGGLPPTAALAEDVLASFDGRAGVRGMLVAISLAQADLVLGHPERAVLRLQREVLTPDLSRLELAMRPRVAETLVESGLKLDREDLVADGLAIATDARDRLDLPGARASAIRAIAAAQTHRNEHEAASEALTGALADIDPAALPIDHALTAFALGRAYAAAGDGERGASLVVEARDRLTACGAGRLASIATRALRSLAPAQARTTTALSGREQQVAALISEGLTNRQIATELRLSEKTVEKHVSAVLSKLGVSSRAAVGRVLVDAL